ncbi:YkvA family protein [Chelatococcus sp. GCM10030263]|uniref:YkvA family protein n=1 Tax=Chelatococcus sp. GCM10030263 TaxID=3273387 RepID=UPI003613B8C2
MKNSGFADAGFSHRLTPEEIAAIRQRAEAEDGSAETRVKRSFWQALKRVARNVPFAEDLVAAYYCALDPGTPRRVKLILFGALAYFILPMDSIPDIIPLFGFGDDMALLAAAITGVASSITDEHRRRARETLTGVSSS